MQPTTRLFGEAVATAHVPFNACSTLRQIQNGHVNARGGRLKIRFLIEMNGPVLTLDCVIGLTAVDPAAVHADAHAS